MRLVARSESTLNDMQPSFQNFKCPMDIKHFFCSWQSLLKNNLPPYLLAAPRDRRVEEGGSIQLSCKVVGNPWPRVKWFKDDDEITHDGKKILHLFIS